MERGVSHSDVVALYRIGRKGLLCLDWRRPPEVIMCRWGFGYLNL